MTLFISGLIPGLIPGGCVLLTRQPSIAIGVDGDARRVRPSRRHRLEHLGQ
jgi:hypothetical protein